MAKYSIFEAETGNKMRRFIIIIVVVVVVVVVVIIIIIIIIIIERCCFTFRCYMTSSEMGK